DETGDDLTSRKLAAKFQTWQDSGTSDLVFLIGGADGLSDGLRQSASLLIRFGRVTWPHMLVRPMLAEQIYRCRQILDGHPYHRD
ncbi:MAG TPA: 23S rRNA (pseudouridine(1915)-N(3))-methyltransferase RlmH, partial [Rhodospirillaceae bacterium]|nr:23S rRNA (pseudouridine(1915)-N(3))-methyltransferase RlmH [Rhodospirillaceae bacterium]